MLGDMDVRIERRRLFHTGDRVPPVDHAINDRGADYYPGRIAIFDIEANSLKAQKLTDSLICAVLLPLDSNHIETYEIRWDDQRDDTRLLGEVIAALARFDIVVGHFIGGYDLGWLRTRAFRATLPLLPQWFYLDTLTLAKAVSPMAQKKSLDFIADLVRLSVKDVETIYQKTAILPNEWSQISGNDPDLFNDALWTIKWHCQQDVFLNREIFYALWPYARSLKNIPRMK